MINEDYISLMHILFFIITIFISIIVVCYFIVIKKNVQLILIILLFINFLRNLLNLWIFGLISLTFMSILLPHFGVIMTFLSKKLSEIVSTQPIILRFLVLSINSLLSAVFVTFSANLSNLLHPFPFTTFSTYPQEQESSS